LFSSAFVIYTANMRVLFLLMTLGFSQHFALALNVSSTKLVEQLFLDFSLPAVHQHDTNGFLIVEPWASEYLSGIRDRRYGDAVWDRYHIAGDVDNSTPLEL
jgi:hypothetical protein